MLLERGIDPRGSNFSTTTVGIIASARRPFRIALSLS
jgi:hypothetical protein